MLVTNHVLSGAVIGAVVKRPLPAFLAGIASHFVLDALPHWGQWERDEHFFRVAVADGLSGLAAMGLVTRAVLRTGAAGSSDAGGVAVSGGSVDPAARRVAASVRFADPAARRVAASVRFADPGARELAVSVLAGMVGAALPDLDKPSSMLLGHQLWPTVVNRFHGRIQNEAPNRFVSHELAAATGFALTAAALIRRHAGR